MSLSYTLRESVSGFRRARLSTAIAITTMLIALILLGIFAAVSINTQRLVQYIRDRVEMEAFLLEPVAPEDLHRIGDAIRNTPGVDSARYISKDEAALIFQKQTGEDILRVLDFNPLPPSFKVNIRDDYKTSAKASALHARLSAIAGVDTVVYRRVLVEVLDTKTTSIYNTTLFLGIFVALSAIILVANAVRLTVHARRHTIRTMELVGATDAFIRLPFLIEGMLQGLIGGIGASAVLYAVIEHLVAVISAEAAAFIHMPPLFYAGVILGGVVLGLLGSLFSVARFLRLNGSR